MKKFDDIEDARAVAEECDHVTWSIGKRGRVGSRLIGDASANGLFMVMVVPVGRERCGSIEIKDLQQDSAPTVYLVALDLDKSTRQRARDTKVVWWDEVTIRILVLNRGGDWRKRLDESVRISSPKFGWVISFSRSR
jgi:hypothetical protein